MEDAQTPTMAAPEMLRQYIERIERLEEEKKEILAGIRDIYGEAKNHGLNPKIMRQIVRLRAMDRQDLMEQDSEIELYRSALGMI